MKMNREFKFRYLMNDVRTHLLKEKGFFDSMDFQYIGNDLTIDINDVNEKTYRIKLYNYDIYDVENPKFIEKMSEIVLRLYEQEFLFQIVAGGKSYESKR